MTDETKKTEEKKDETVKDQAVDVKVEKKRYCS